MSNNRGTSDTPKCDVAACTRARPRSLRRVARLWRPPSRIGRKLPGRPRFSSQANSEMGGPVRPGGKGWRGGEGRPVDGGRRWGSAPRERWAAERSAAGLSSEAPRGIHLPRVHGKEVIRKRRRGGSPPEDGLSSPVARRVGAVEAPWARGAGGVRWGNWAERSMPRASPPEGVRAGGEGADPRGRARGRGAVLGGRAQVLGSSRCPSLTFAIRGSRGGGGAPVAAPVAARVAAGAHHRSRGRSPIIAAGAGHPSSRPAPAGPPSRPAPAAPSRPAIPNEIPLLAAPARRAQPGIRRFHWPVS